MSKEYGRNRRVADLVQQELAIIMQRELDTREFGLVTVSAVSVSPDLHNATVFVTFLDNTQTCERLIESLNQRAGHFRHELARQSPLRTMPRLKFEFDESIEKGSRLSSLIDEIQQNRPDVD